MHSAVYCRLTVCEHLDGIIASNAGRSFDTALRTGDHLHFCRIFLCSMQLAGSADSFLPALRNVCHVCTKLCCGSSVCVLQIGSTMPSI